MIVLVSLRLVSLCSFDLTEQPAFGLPTSELKSVIQYHYCSAINFSQRRPIRNDKHSSKPLQKISTLSVDIFCSGLNTIQYRSSLRLYDSDLL